MNLTHMIVNEIILFRVVDGELHYRVHRMNLTQGAAPDKQIREFLHWGETEPAGALIHSTSWRADTETDSIFLTWAVLPDLEVNAVTVPLVDKKIAQGSDGSHPVPESLQMENVVAHAARHLSFLSHTDSGVAAAIHKHTNLHDALIAFAPDVAVNAEHEN